MTRKSLNLFIDHALIPLFVLTVLGGVKLHVSGHRDVHEVWHAWAVFHVLSSVVFFSASVIHVRLHWAWYKALFHLRFQKKSINTVLLSLLMVLVSITAISLLFFVDGANTAMGLRHYRIGLMCALFGGIHLFRRLPILAKMRK
ncbi:MAG: hypothetical protein IKU63_09020 [Bacteroidaceae bacterium]|nr:hypothetical protein [Bacteroidaceae bacterium]